MAASKKSGKKSAKVKDLKSKKVSSAKAKSVKGGALLNTGNVSFKKVGFKYTNPTLPQGMVSPLCRG